MSVCSAILRVDTAWNGARKGAQIVDNLPKNKAPQGTGHLIFLTYSDTIVDALRMVGEPSVLCGRTAIEQRFQLGNVGDMVAMIEDEVRRAAPQSDPPAQPRVVDQQARQRVAKEIIDAATPLRDKAEAARLRMVGYLLDMVILEAKDAAGEALQDD